MPSSKVSLDLDIWNNFLPQERTNDHEYNLLLHKLKTLYNEVKNYQQLHSNCSVTRAAKSETLPSFGAIPTRDQRNASPSNGNLKFGATSDLTNTNGQQVTSNNKRSHFQHQNSVPFANGSSRASDNQFIQNFLNNNQFSSHNHDAGSSVQHYNSSYNLPTLSSSSSTNYCGPSRPEIRQRTQVTHSRLQLSKSSERLDTINNNHLQPRSNLTTRDLDNLQISDQLTPPVVRDSRYLQCDANIYDAVSPDDMSSNVNVSASINRFSNQHKNVLEASKSALAFGSNTEAKKSIDTTPQSNLSGSKSTPSAHTSEQHSNSFGSSILLNNNSSSSLSLIMNESSKTHNDSPHYANYVNMDFFLKRSSPSVDGLEEDVTNDDTSEGSDEEATRMTNSLSSDQICDDIMRSMSPRSIARKLSTKVHTNSSTSLTPASSSDFLDDLRNTSSNHPTAQLSQPSSKYIETSNRINSFFLAASRETDKSLPARIHPNTKVSPNKNSLSHQTLKAIQENSTSFDQPVSLDAGRLESDDNALVEAHNTMRSFLSDLNLCSGNDIFEDKAQRRIVKESFAVEFSGRRKLRHLFLFNDVIVCAKYQASSKQKFTFDVKWYMNLNGVSILDMNDINNHIKYDKEAIENQILAIRTNLMLLRGQMQHTKRSKSKQPSKIIKKLKKKRTELEAELVLLLPHLPLVIKHLNGKKYTFFLSSNFDRNQWIESIKFLQSQLPTTKSSTTSPSSSELQAWIQTCRKNLNPSLGTFLLRSNCDDDLLYGDLNIQLSFINGITKSGLYYFCFEVDSYGHFSQKASTSVTRIEQSEHSLNEEYIFPLDGAHTLRILLYEDLGPNSKPSVVGKAHIELSRSWFLEKPVEKLISFNSNLSLSTKLSYSNSELLLMRVPHAKLCPTFGMDITQVCRKEKTKVPLLIQLCINEVERRGMREVGVYRMSGTSTDIQRLKKSFETNPYVAEILLRDIDINSVTGFLKTYLREMPEGLFSNKLYLKFVSAFNIPPSKSLDKTKTMLELFHKIPPVNQDTIIYLVEHLVKLNKFESYNKMSLTNLATVLGPNILRPPTESASSSSSDPFTAVVIGSMSQAGILYFFLDRKYRNLTLTELDPSEVEG